MYYMYRRRTCYIQSPGGGTRDIRVPCCSRELHGPKTSHVLVVAMILPVALAAVTLPAAFAAEEDIPSNCLVWNDGCELLFIV